MSPREIVILVPIDAANHVSFPFGAYVQTHEQHYNSMYSRKIGAIALHPNGNGQGSHIFFSL